MILSSKDLILTRAKQYADGGKNPVSAGVVQIETSRSLF